RKPSTLIVGVLDSGVQADHIDLKENMWVNPKEIAGNGKDDDNNGYVDDVHGWNFIGGKDGKNVDGDTLEKVRVYKSSYLPLFESKDEAKNAENKTKYPKEFADYQAIKAEIQDNLKESHQALVQYKMMTEMIDKGFPVLIKDFGDTVVTEETLSKYQPSEQALAGLQMFAFIPKDYWEGQTMQEIYDSLKEEFTEAIEYFDSKIKYHYNLEFDPRGIVGDNYADKTERFYGNSDVEGPDAGHGTHVAGLIAAVRGNNLGIDGIGGNTVKIMSV